VEGRITHELKVLTSGTLDWVELPAFARRDGWARHGNNDVKMTQRLEEAERPPRLT
jgi:hypothetical protein